MSPVPTEHVPAEEGAAIWRRSVSQFYRIARAKNLTRLRVHARVLFMRSEIEALAGELNGGFHVGQ
jgi:hypothetical protein